MRLFRPACFVVLLPLSAVAGDLNPPPGPVAPTNRVTLNAQVITLPYTISSPGSYVLTSNLTGVPGQHGIIIDSPNVSLDLNGFSLRGVSNALDGIHVPFTRTNIQVLNGSVHLWSGHGVNMNLADNSLVRNIRSFGNMGDGIRIGQGSSVIESGALSNSGEGILVANGSTARSCTARGNTLNGIRAAQGCIIENCTARDNLASGIYAINDTTIIGCTVTFSGMSGIRATAGCTITDCVSFGSGTHGFEATADVLISNCTSRSNSVAGFWINDRSHIVNSSAMLNLGDGIRADENCKIVGNNCERNGLFEGVGAGICVFGEGNHVEGNRVSENDTGLEAFSGANLFIRNTLQGNTVDTVFAPNNVVGEMLDFSGGGTLTSSNPWANIIY